MATWYLIRWVDGECYWRPGIGWVVGNVVVVGVLTAAAAAAYAPPPPAPGLCWYYTDPGYRAGYWAECQ
jgi:hypothetical protein